MGMMTEFKAFIAKGNVVDLAVGVVIGAAFGKIVTALVDGIVMPMLSMVTGGVSFKDWKHVITPAITDATGKQTAAEVAIRYGEFIQVCIDFLLIAFVIFLFIKAYNRMRKPAEDMAPVVEDLIKLLDNVSNSLRRGRYPDDQKSRAIAKVMRAVANDLDA